MSDTPQGALSPLPRTDISRRISRLALLLVTSTLLTGCASFGRGVTEAVLAAQAREQEDRRQCEVDGAPFTGLDTRLESQAARSGRSSTGTERYTTKLVYIHGIGSQQPGHGARLLRSLAQELDLNVRAEQSKRIVLAPPGPPERPMGEVNLLRIRDTAREKELVFVELTWDAITEMERETLAFDSSQLFTSRRAALNQTIRNFTNAALPDPVAFAGVRGPDIVDAVQQTLCWSVSASWEDLPQVTEGTRCEDSPIFGNRVQADELVLATHSLGSRAAIDALGELSGKRSDAERAPLPGLADKTVTMFMLSNQLPLLEAGSVSPDFERSRADYCEAGSELASARFLKRLELVAISDPNDLLSYPVPQRWIDDHVDPRLCTRVRNVTINIAHVRNLPVLGEFADPLTAHTGYVGDARVISLMAGGMGHDGARPLATERCSWIEADAKLD